MKKKQPAKKRRKTDRATTNKPRTKTYILETIEQAVQIGATLCFNWFRGHDRVYGELTPSVFRSKFEVLRKIRDWENELYHSFVRMAPSRASNLPEKDDVEAWLFLMQHHGTPTRLLDWSGSVLIGLYFAVRDLPKEDGELWSMYAQALNTRSGVPGDPTPNNPHLRFLAREPLVQDPKGLARELGISKIPTLPLAVLPPLEFPRLVTQSSRFTIHPRPVGGSTISELLKQPKHLVRYIIPSRYKAQLLENLSALEITHATLFPDLDALSVSLRQQARVIAYNPVPPPKASGPWRTEDEPG